MNRRLKIWKIGALLAMMKHGQRIAERDRDWLEFREFSRHVAACERRLKQLYR
jgi:hypothetical protein